MYFLINDQSGITQYRKTHDNIGRAFHPTECVNREGVGAMFESGCRKAAFDSVGWEFLYKVMEKFGFHKTFTHNTASLHVRLCMFCFVFLFVCFSCVWLQVADLFYFTSALSFNFLPFLLVSL